MTLSDHPGSSGMDGWMDGQKCSLEAWGIEIVLKITANRKDIVEIG